MNPGEAAVGLSAISFARTRRLQRTVHQAKGCRFNPSRGFRTRNSPDGSGSPETARPWFCGGLMATNGSQRTACKSRPCGKGYSEQRD